MPHDRRLAHISMPFAQPSAATALLPVLRLWPVYRFIVTWLSFGVWNVAAPSGVFGSFSSDGPVTSGPGLKNGTPLLRKFTQSLENRTGRELPSFTPWSV